MRASHKTLSALALLVTAVAVPAMAQSSSAPLTNYPTCAGTPSKADSDQAHEAFKIGKRFFDEADYASAIHNFVDAYKLDCTKTELLTIIARANELAGNRADAVHALEVYVQRATNLGAEDKAQIQRRIENLKAQIAAQTPIATTTAPTAMATAVPTATATATATATTPTATATTSAPPPVVDERHHTLLPWIVAGVGAATAITGAILYFAEKSSENNAANECIGSNVNPCRPVSSSNGVSSIQSSYNSARNLVVVGSVLTYSGIGVAAVGVVWHFLEPTGPKPPANAAIAPAVGPGFAGVSVGGRF